MRRSTVLTLAMAAAVVVAGCDAIADLFPKPAPTPQPCGQVFNAIRCLAMTDTVAAQLHRTREDITGMEVIPDPTPEVRDGVTILQTTSGGLPVDLNVRLADGTIQQVTLMCVGVNTEPACVDDPHLRATSVTQGGYFDTPEGASPVPTAAPDALSDATGLRIDHLDIPIDHVGSYEVRLGEANLPNGILTTADFALVDDWPAGLTIIPDSVSLEVRSLVDGATISNIYEHGWRKGTEPVEAVLVFEVFRFEPGATLGIRDVVVR